jgi:hypothetical protein
LRFYNQAFKEELRMEENKTNEVVEKKWYQKTWVIATGLILTHIAAAAVGYVIGANSGDESGENADTDSLDN